MTTLAAYTNCSTAGIRALDLQLISQIQKIAPGVLGNFAHLSVDCGPGVHAYLQKPAVEALGRAIAARGKHMRINSAFRTICQQCVLYAHYRHGHRCGIRAAAIPGLSNHNGGLGIDIEDAQGWRPYLERFGWDWIGSFDPMHFDFEGGGIKDLRWLSIKAFQQLYNYAHPTKKIPEDGKWGPKTEQALLGTASTGFLKVPDGIPTSVPEVRIASTQSLREGMSGDEVRLLQQALIKHGASLKADGQFGIQTTSAVRTIQLASGLVADGVVGLSTKKVLELA